MTLMILPKKDGSGDSDNDGLPDTFENNEACFYEKMGWINAAGNLDPDVIKNDLTGLDDNLKAAFDGNIDKCAAWNGNFGSSRKKRGTEETDTDDVAPAIMEKEGAVLGWLKSALRKTRSADPQNGGKGKKGKGKQAKKGNRKKNKNRKAKKGKGKNKKGKKARKGKGKKARKGKGNKKKGKKVRKGKGNKKKGKKARKGKGNKKKGKKGGKRKNRKAKKGKKGKGKKDGNRKSRKAKKGKKGKGKDRNKKSKGKGNKRKGKGKSKGKGKENGRSSSQMAESIYNQLWCFDLSLEQVLEQCVENKIQN